MKKRLLSVLLAVLMLCSLAPGALAEDLTPVSSWNDNAQSYHQGGWTYDWTHEYYTLLRHANPVYSYLFQQEDGFCRVEYNWWEQPPQLIVETYSADRTILSQKTLEMELPLFGGFFAGADANYFVFGQAQTTKTGDDSEEVIRVVKYSKDFRRLDSVSIYGNNTTVPFDASSLRMVEDDAYLYVHTGHEMYQSKNDGLNHQANLTFIVRKSDLTVTDIRSRVSNNGYGYVSHSFNQFILLDEGKLVTLDHGDAHPRAPFLCRCDAADSDGKAVSYPKNLESVNLMTFQGVSGQNDTGANLGGLVATATHYLVAGSSVDQSLEDIDLDFEQRNVFICAVPKTSFTADSVQTYWLTRYPAGVAEENLQRVSTPHLVALPDGRALVLWTLDDTLYYQFLAANGEPTGEVKSRTGRLSDCAPTVIDGLVQWYVTERGTPSFYAIDPSEQPHTEHVPGLQGVVDPDCLFEGYTGDTVCVVCGELLEKGSVVPALGHTWGPAEVEQEPTCTKSGYTKTTCTVCGAWTYQNLPALGHDWGDWETVTPATEDASGLERSTCARCGETETREVEPLGHTHELVYVPGRDASCTEPGYEEFWRCSGCGKLFEDASGWWEIDAPEQTDALGHDWGDWKVTKPATLDAEGEETRTCDRCGETETHTVPKLTPANPFTDVAKGEYYYDPVLWAVNHVPQITNGTSPTTFSPNATCTRGQVVTFLWRAMGCPEPKSTKNPFTDVKSGDYSYKPVLWAVENNITNGTSATAFSPNSPCTRAHVVTFLWRAHQEPAAGKTNPFTDVPAGQYYTDAVLWAVSKNITNGTSATTFSPARPCTRGQIVTFLYRDLG